MQSAIRLSAVEAHAEGEPGRVITGGLPPIPGDSVFEKMQWLRENRDDIRKLLLREPRGYPALCCNLIVPACHPAADAGYIIMEQTEYPPMSGSNTICVATVLLEGGILPMTEPVTRLTLEAPAGLITIDATCREGKVTEVRFRNVPAFAVALDAEIEVPGMGRVAVDIAWGGMFYVQADADRLGIALEAENGAEIARVSEALRHAAAEQLPVTHPDNPRITGPTISYLHGAPTTPGTDGRGAATVSTGCFDPDRPHVATGILDRSPCGTATSARMAVLHARGLLRPGEPFVNAGPLGTTFSCVIEEEAQVGPYPAIVPSIAGQAWIYGISQYRVDPSDPFPEGFTVGDIW